jgi:uncharacterized membrane protein
MLEETLREGGPIMRTRDLIFASFAAGAAFMYFFDPDRGRRRRHLTQDKLGRWSRESRDFARIGMTDLQQRARGLRSEAGARLWSRSVPDEILVERVRSVMGHHCSHPRAISVGVDSGNVVLSGAVLAREVDGLLAAVSRVPGVRRVVNDLQAHADASDVPELQGGRAPRAGSDRWQPGTRLLAVVGGGGLLGYSLVRRSLLSPFTALAGAAAVLRAAFDQPVCRTFGWEHDEPAFEFQKSIWIGAPVETVYGLWSQPEQFPRFMEHLSAVERLDDARYRWAARGPAGLEVSWVSEITERKPNELIRWESVEGSQVVTWGQASFVEEGGGTRLHLWMAYTPPTGGLGHVVAWLLGDDPKQALDEDLVRVKSLIEQGHTTVDGEDVRREELGLE